MGLKLSLPHGSQTVPVKSRDIRVVSLYVKSGAPGWNRTSDPQLRRLMLYPTELRARAYGS
jgi:hypothetical protein